MTNFEMIAERLNDIEKFNENGIILNAGYETFHGEKWVQMNKKEFLEAFERYAVGDFNSAEYPYQLVKDINGVTFFALSQGDE